MRYVLLFLGLLGLTGCSGDVYIDRGPPAYYAPAPVIVYPRPYYYRYYYGPHYHGRR